MRIELPRGLLVALAIWASACDSQADIASKSAPTKVEVKSSLEGMATLPDRLHWSVTSSLPLEEVREVRFTIDGKKFWSDSEPPFSYGEDGGYFVTTWLASGEHRFRARMCSMTRVVSGARPSRQAFANRMCPRR